MIRVPVPAGTAQSEPNGPTGGVLARGLLSFRSLPAVHPVHPTGGVSGSSLLQGELIHQVPPSVVLHHCICPLLCAPGREILCEWTGIEGVEWVSRQRPSLEDYA